MEPAEEGGSSWWEARARRHLAVGTGWLVLAGAMLAAALAHRAALRYALFAVWAAIGIGFLVDAGLHRRGPPPDDP